MDTAGLARALKERARERGEREERERSWYLATAGLAGALGKRLGGLLLCPERDVSPDPGAPIPDVPDGRRRHAVPAYPPSHVTICPCHRVPACAAARQ